MTITINGKTFHGTSLRNLRIENGRVFADNVELTDFPEVGKTVLVQVKGNVQEVRVDSCQGLAVHGNVESVHVNAGKVDIDGNVTGSVTTASGDVSCKVVGSVSTASGDVTAETIRGSVQTASGDITRRS